MDNWMGFVTVPEGTLTYQAASKYNRNGAAEDFIYYQPEKQTAPRAVIILPGRNATAAASVRKSLKWSVSGTECTLSFTRPNGEKMELKVML